MNIPGLQWAIAGIAILCLAALLMSARDQISALEQALSERDLKIAALTNTLIAAETRHKREMQIVAADIAASRARLVRTDAIKKDIDHAETGIVPAAIRMAVDGLRDAHAGDRDDQDDDPGAASDLRR